MLQRKLFSTSLAGVQFFDRLEKLEKNDQELREIYVTCLALGFVGRYSINPNAPELAELLHHQHKLLRPEQARKPSATSGMASLFPEAYRLVTNSVRHRQWHVGSRMFWLFVILVPAVLIGALAYWFDSLLSIQASEITRRLQ
jgi:type VI secretion system protein ImpK